MPFDTRDFTEYRRAMGLRTLADAKQFLGAKDIRPPVNLDHVDNLTDRIAEIIRRLDQVVVRAVRQTPLAGFIRDFVMLPKDTIVGNGLIHRLTNQGRHPEDVLFSWLRGYAVCAYFGKAFASIFGVSPQDFVAIGLDDFNNPTTFARAPRADLTVNLAGRQVRLEVQSGFQGQNDIKAHKVHEARSVLESSGEPTVLIHIDLFNGQVAFVRLDAVPPDDPNFITRTQMEGQLVLEIDPNYFVWRLADPCPRLADLELEL